MNEELGIPFVKRLLKSRKEKAVSVPNEVDQERTENSWPNETDKKVLRGIAYSLGGLIVVAGTTKALQWWLRKKQGEQALQDATEEGSHESYANALHLAFLNDGLWGTSVEVVRRTIIAIPTFTDWEKVFTAYKRITKGRSLLFDMKNELTTTEWTEMLAIINSKPLTRHDAPQYRPDLWAERLYQAMIYTWLGLPQTDEDAIKAVLLEMPDQTAWNDTKTAYFQKFGADLKDELDGDLWMWGDLDWRAVLKGRNVLAGMQNALDIEWLNFQVSQQIHRYRNALINQRWKEQLNQKNITA